MTSRRDFDRQFAAFRVSLGRHEQPIFLWRRSRLFLASLTLDGRVSVRREFVSQCDRGTISNRYQRALVESADAADDCAIRSQDLDLLDAERASASKEDRPINKILLIKALREASGLGLAQAKTAVEDYLRRRGGENLPSGSTAKTLAWFAILCLGTSAFLIWILTMKR